MTYHSMQGVSMLLLIVLLTVNYINMSYANIPTIMYGTAWKAEKTRALVSQALDNGFRAIDTACQPKHYNEPGVGDGIQDYLKSTGGTVTRGDLFIQTKFTPLSGQDPKRIPYDVKSPLDDQVKQSLTVSLANLGTEYIDSLILHSPMKRIEDTLLIWTVFESFVKDKKVRYLGLSNTYDIKTLQTVYDAATIKPTFIQNRFYKDSNFDVDIRAFCKKQSMYYQSFWTLTANPEALLSPTVTELTKKYHKTPEQIFYKFVQSLDIIPLTGTTSIIHMKHDLELPSFNLTEKEVASISMVVFK